MIAIRRGVAEDLDAVESLSAALHKLEGLEMGGAARRAAIVPLLTENGPGAVWVAEDAGDVIGFAAVSFGWSIEFGGRDGFLDELCVAEDRRGEGVGAALLKGAQTGAAALGCRALHLEVARENASARALYAAQGFSLRDHYNLMSKSL